MYILQIDHRVRDYESWKRAFENDPADRQKSGVRSYRIFRLQDDPNHVLVDLEFLTLSEAEAFRGKLMELWKPIEGKLIESPKARIAEAVESKSYSV